MSCEWEGCREPATHEVTVTLPEGEVKVWHVCTEHDKAVKVTTTRSRNLQLDPTPDSPPSSGTVHCGVCDLPLDEASDLPAEDRKPCPVCGAIVRIVKVSAADQLGPVLEEIGLTMKRPGVGVLRRLKTGDSITRLTGTPAKVTLDIDEEHHVYRDEIVLSDGTHIVTTAALRDHRGHG